MQDILKKYEGHQMDEKVQQELNQPLKDETGVSDEHKNFLKNLIQELEKGELDIHNPETLYNHSVYDKLEEEMQDKVGTVAVNVMGIIRQIQQLWDLDHTETFQIQNLVETVWQMKSKFEKEHGDVFII